ncbi:MAG TPA: replication-relaxation family protein [Candidatus Angelobacter sp.]|nr:replication-relaxation family protein [Candidatus Angelobacter sp.]
MIGNNRKLVLQPRDRRLLEELATMRVVDREQAKIVAGFSSTTRANTRLLALSRAGLLRRCFLGTQAGGTKALYMLSAKGAGAVGVPLRGPQRRADEILIADFFMEHQLRVNDIYCTLKYRPIPAQGVSFREWSTFQETLTPAIRLVPDGYFQLETPSGTIAAFIEIDLGNESLTIWKEKVSKYLELALSGEYERKFRQSRFRVLVITHSERRMQSIRTVIAEATDKIFWLASLESIASGGFFSPVWLRPRDDTRHPFIKAETTL